MAEIERMALENLSEWIFDENKIVSFKWLSFTLSMHVNESKRILEKFVTQNKDKPGCQLSVVYCISGHAASSDFQVFKVELVTEEFLKETEASFIPPVSRHVYSVQKSASSISNLFIADYDLIKQNILSSNKFSAIYCPSARLRVPSNAVHSFPEEVVLAPSHNQNKVEKSKLNAVASGVSSFFAKQAQKTTSVVSKPSESGKPEPGFQPTDTKANASSSLVKSNSVDADSHQLSHTSNGKKAIKELQKVKEKEKAGQRKRLRIAEISSSEDEEEEDPLAENPKDMDIEIISPSENSGIPVPATDDSTSTESEANQKRVERKLVSKTYTNDEGFMVTEKVWETSEVMLDSVPVEKLTIEQPPPSKKPTIPLQQSATKKKAGVSKGSNKQASLMKFFNKQ